ncbi:MAG: chemotaxis protein [Clostridium sp.]|uniref:chemotaxis protein n=1 Tax=Clostridium sp. TaxID=1506 RepID=UPI0025BB5B44|nr:chemotaxis protein [Clostridium sp.]MCH3964304.1 chemotaxis protein [Clostridium sp.]MCI1715479.1 chemotaxis protein [Clostridium sp.]MCI1799729.1 chemotaxis protein [Clostridium sp.]MCI1813663.1 chemotaxis protein [Clostridium sp.]MCI1870542.1 chemotaxis protein [Clostridium sp.]
MYNILMFGTGRMSIWAENVLNNDVNILAYVDNDSSRWDSTRNGKIVVGPDKIEKYNYDYIIIGSQFNQEIYGQLIDMRVDNDKILQFSVFIDNCFNYYKYNLDKFISSSEKIELMTTGISYAEIGFSEHICCKKSFKFAVRHQDLFYDYHTVKYILKNFPQKAAHIKYVLIGLCYYSFQYDMSLSAMANKTVIYYPILKTAHHFKNIEKVYEGYRINKNIADNIFRKNQKGNYDFKWDMPTTLKDYSDKWKIGRESAVRDCNKNYPKTAAENESIFVEYLKFLKNYNIKPIVLVYPVTRYYSKYFSDKIEEEFHSIINKTRQKYDFQYIDYFRSDLFDDDDFGDVSHLNWRGAEKFTRILNKEIDW